MKPIKGFEGLYEIAEDGTVISIERKAWATRGYRIVKERVLKPNLTGPKRNYYQIELSKNSIRTKFKLHRLVAEHYLPNPNNYPVVMHIDNNPLNNHISNLQWGTQSMNMQQCVADGRHSNQWY